MFEIADTEKNNQENTNSENANQEVPNELVAGAKIRVIGIGGGGCNAVNTMIRAGLTGVEYIVANTDSQALNASLAPVKLQLGAEITKGLGAGANPEMGRKATLDEYEQLSEVLQGADMVFITAGMGGGTGTGGAPVVAKLARELGALTVGVVTKPFLFEGKKRFRQAEAGITMLEETVDSLITIPNQRLLYLAGESLSLVDTFKKADDVLLNAVRGISDLINNTGHINADFADVSTVMVNKGLALMGTGSCEGPDRAIKAATEAISSPLLEDITIDGATGIIINITGNESLTMHETNEAVTLIMEAADDDAEIIFGTVIDDSMGEAVKVTVIATGLGGQNRVTSASLNQQKAPEQVVHVEERPTLNMNTTTIESNVAEQSINSINISNQNEITNLDQVSPAVKEMPSKPSTLIDSIKDAAVKYEASKAANASHIESTRQNINGSENLADQRVARDPRAANSSSKAKSIAEKLGFINFDEEELDTPTYMRREDTV